MPRRKLTIAQLAHLTGYGWEVEKTIGVCQTAERFKEYIANMPIWQVQSLLTNIYELTRVIHEIGDAEIELSAHGEHPYLTKLNSFLTPTARAAGTEEYLDTHPGDDNANIG